MREDTNPSRINTARAKDGTETVAQFTPGELFSVLQRGWKIIALTTLMFVVLIALQLVRATPRYDAYAQMLLGEQGLSDRVAFNLVESATLSNSVIEGELAVLRSNALLVRVAQRLELDTVPEFNPTLIGGHRALDVGRFKNQRQINARPRCQRRRREYSAKRH